VISLSFDKSTTIAVSVKYIITYQIYISNDRINNKNNNDYKNKKEQKRTISKISITAKTTTTAIKSKNHNIDNENYIPCYYNISNNFNKKVQD